jgi:hypothetical protein
VAPPKSLEPSDVSLPGEFIIKARIGNLHPPLDKGHSNHRFAKLSITPTLPNARARWSEYIGTRPDKAAASAVSMLLGFVVE